MPSALWCTSFFVVALLLSTANAEHPDFLNRYQDQLHVQREEDWFQQQIRMSYIDLHMDRAYRLIDSSLLSEARAELELAYLPLHNSHNNEAAHRFRQDMDQALNDPQFAEEDTRALERDIEEMRSEVQRLTHQFDLTLYQAWRSHTQQVRTSPSVFGEGVIPSQGGLELTYQPPGIGFRDERIFQIFGRFLWSTEPRSLNVDDDSLQGSLGVRYKPFRQLNAYVSVERLFKIGHQAENNWLLRVTYGWDQGARLKTGASLRPYSFLYGDLGYFVEHPSNVAFYGEARQGLALQIGNAVMLTPHLVLDGRYQTLQPDRNAYLEGGLGASLKYFFNATRYETPRSSLELLIQYKIGLIESVSGWVVTGILQF